MPNPNILIILADDIGVDAFRVDPQAKTVVAQVTGETDTAGPMPLPNFGRMVASGVHFQNTWAHPVCTPTRACLWTGTQPWKTGLGYPTGGGDNLPAQTVTGEAVRTLAQALGGHRCAMFGKWDLGTAKTPVQWGWNQFAGIFRGGLRPDGVTQYGFPGPPSRIGWDRLKGAVNSSKPAKCAAAAAALEAKYDLQFLKNNPDLRFYIWEKDTVAADGTANPPQPPSAREHLYATEDQVADAKKWIADNASAGPWCVALNLITPHEPFHVPPPGTFKVQFTDPSNPTVQEMLVAMLESMDYYVGDLLAAIDGQLANTVVIFVGDNGTQDMDTDTGESVDAIKGDDKSTDSIGGIHVPLIVADGGLMKKAAPCYLQGAPRSIATPIHIIDIYNTVLDIAGVTGNAAKDSISIAPHLALGAGPKRTHNFSQMYQLPEDGITAGINASTCDTDSKYKLTCKLLVDAHGALVDRAGKATTSMVFDYEFSQLEPEPGIPGSLVEKLIATLQANADGTFTVTEAAYEAKILELYAVLAREYLTNTQIRFPVITKQPLAKLPAELLNTPVLFENVYTKRYLFSDGSPISGDRGAERGWLATSGFASPNVVGADDNYYNRAYWIIRPSGDYYLIENQETKRYLFSDGLAISGKREAEGGWLASSGFASPNVVGADDNYYNRALWTFRPSGDSFLVENAETRRYALSDGAPISGNRGAEGGWLASSGFASPKIVGADANYYNRALWTIKKP